MEELGYFGVRDFGEITDEIREWNLLAMID